ncbi:MAG: transaldolase [Candidatus Paceibacterota bacterium]|jgi:transaldolase
MKQKLKLPKIKIFSDGACRADILKQAKIPLVKGFTTNPSLMRKSGITDYEKFAKDILRFVKTKPISFEVFSDDFSEMERQAREIASWGKNVYIKIPITNTKGKSSFNLVKKLSYDNIKINVTAVMTLGQVKNIVKALNPKTPSIVSVFAGRIADTGVNPIPTMRAAAKLLSKLPKAELLWASPRQPLDVFLAAQAKCDIITVFPEIIGRFDRIGKDLKEYSLETVKMFYEDARTAGYKL